MTAHSSSRSRGVVCGVVCGGIALLTPGTSFARNSFDPIEAGNRSVRREAHLRATPAEGNVGDSDAGYREGPGGPVPGGHMAEKDTGGQQRATRRSADVDEAVDQETTSTDLQERHEKLNEDVDAILDEIDDVLEENAEEFVRSYIQKGGQ
jgi:ubiquitin-like protein Pup